jgi:hypothetical protein
MIEGADSNEWVAAEMPDHAVVAFSDEMSPHRPGVMPLFCAVHWCASKGGTIGIPIGDESAWETACKELLARIGDREIYVSASRGTLEQEANQKIRGKALPELFEDISINCSFVPSKSWIASVLADELTLELSPCSNEKEWRDGRGDTLCTRQGSYFERVRVRRSDVAKFWPFGGASGNINVATRAGETEPERSGSGTGSELPLSGEKKSEPLPPVDEVTMKEILRSEMERRRTVGEKFNKKHAEEFVNSIDPRWKREMIRPCLREVMGVRGRGRPRENNLPTNLW